MTVYYKPKKWHNDVKALLLSFRTPQFWRTIVFMAVGSLITASATNGLLVPNNFFDGGVSGISLIVFYLTNWPPLGVIYFVLNVPIFLICWRYMSLRFVAISAIGAIFLSTSLILTRHVHLDVKEPFMAAILAGIIVGAGIGLYVRFGGTLGGLDMVAMVIKKKFSIPLGNTFLAVNAIPIIGAILIYDINVALHTGIYMYVQAFVVEKVQTGFSQRKGVFIISQKPELLAEQVMKKLDRGVTFIHTSGGYTNREQKMIYTITNMRELGRLKELLFQFDPEAFVAVSNTSEVIGKRFLTWEDEGFSEV